MHVVGRELHTPLVGYIITWENLQGGIITYDDGKLTWVDECVYFALSK